MKTKTQYTLGPWKLGGIGTLVYGRKGAIEDVICVTDNENPQRYANARLIAAAPELLEAAKKMKNVIDEMTDKKRHEVFGYQSVWTDLSDAIAKAEVK